MFNVSPTCRTAVNPVHVLMRHSRHLGDYEIIQGKNQSYHKLFPLTWSCMIHNTSSYYYRRTGRWGTKLSPNTAATPTYVSCSICGIMSLWNVWNVWRWLMSSPFPSDFCQLESDLTPDFCIVFDKSYVWRGQFKEYRYLVCLPHILNINKLEINMNMTMNII